MLLSSALLHCILVRVTALIQILDQNYNDLTEEATKIKTVAEAREIIKKLDSHL